MLTLQQRIVVSRLQGLPVTPMQLSDRRIWHQLLPCFLRKWMGEILNKILGLDLQRLKSFVDFEAKGVTHCFCSLTNESSCPLPRLWAQIVASTSWCHSRPWKLKANQMTLLWSLFIARPERNHSKSYGSDWCGSLRSSFLILITWHLLLSDLKGLVDAFQIKIHENPRNRWTWSVWTLPDLLVGFDSSLLLGEKK